MIYLLAGTKGGIGKSTMACNWAASLALLQRDVCLVDMDYQGHSTAWVDNRNTLTARLLAEGGYELAKVHCAQAIVDPKKPTQSVAPLLRSYAERYQDLVLDAGGRNSPELRAALRVCDWCVMPYLASTFDLYTVEDMAELLEVAREYNPKMQAIGFVNRASNNWSSKRASQAQLFLDRFSALMRRSEVIVHDRDAFSAAITDGLSVAEFGPKGLKAADEFSALVHETQGRKDEEAA